MRRRREISVLNTNTVLTAIVFYLLLIGKAFDDDDAKKISLKREKNTEEK